MIASGMVRDLAANLNRPLPEKLLLKEEDEEDRCEDCLRHLSFCGCGEYGEEEP